MVGIVLASHGGLAQGILESAAMIFGPPDDVIAVTLTPDMGPDELRGRLAEAVSSLGDQEHVLFFVDLFGATPFNQASALLDDRHPDWVMLTGLNLPMLVQALGDRMDEGATAANVAQAAFLAAREGVRVRPEALQPADGPSVPPAGVPRSGGATLAPGTVVGDGKIKVGLVRIDTRLLHGQVATAWTKQVGPNRILIVSDGVAHDEMRRTLLTQAAPPGVKVNVIPVHKLVEIWDDPRFGATKAMLLFENPQDLLKAVEDGVRLTEVIDRVNVGSMAHSEGKTMLSDAISCDEADIAVFRRLRDHGIALFAQKVPSAPSMDLWGLVKKAGMDV